MTWTPPDYACRFCHHRHAEHNPIVGCLHCRCMAHPSEAMPRTEKEDAVVPIAPGKYLDKYRPKEEPTVNVIWKEMFEPRALELVKEFYTQDGRVLSVGIGLEGLPSVWFIGPTKTPKHLVRVSLIGTGIPYDPAEVGYFLGSVTYENVVLHAFVKQMKG